MVQFTFPTSVFEHFELQVARTNSDNVSLCLKSGEACCTSPTVRNTVSQQLGYGFIHISSCEKNGQEIWKISLAGLPLPSAVPIQEPVLASPVNPNVTNGRPPYPLDFSAPAANHPIDDWSPWKMSDLLGTMSTGPLPMNVTPAQMASPEGSIANLQQLSDALAQHPLEASQYALAGPSTLSSSDYTFNTTTQQPREGAVPSGISSPSSHSDCTASDDEDHQTSSSGSSPTSTFPCSELSCTKTFKRGHARNNHVKRRHSTPRNSNNTPPSAPSRIVHRCSLPECGEQFTRRHDRMRHEWSQHGIQSDFTCSHCPRLFASQNRLDRHYVEKHPTIAR